MKRFLVGLAKVVKMRGLLFGVLAIFICANSAQANLVVYTDRADFLANAGSTTVYNFESDSAGDISPKSYSGGANSAVLDFGDFSIDSTSSGIYWSEIREESGNKDIYFNSYSNSASLNVIFDNAVTAFGFNWIAEGNQSYDHSIFSFNGTTWDLGIPGNSGFFGLIEDSGPIAAGSIFSFGQDSTNWSGMSFDNITYSSSAPSGDSPVPEPTTMLLLGTGLIGLVGLGRRKIK